MRPPVPPLAALVLAASLVAAAAPAEPPAADRGRAAALFDDALAKFRHAEFVAAARAFLAADDLAPNPAALTNAIQAGRRGGDYLLVAQAAERAIARGDVVVEARESLADAAARLAKIELSCSPAPCSLTLDGVASTGPSTWALPGTHRIAARAPSGATAEEKLLCVAGATCRAALSPVLSTSEPKVAAKADRSPPPEAPPSHGLPRGIFFAGLGVTVVLGAVTAWSGADAISAKGALPAGPSQAQEDDVRGRARRTDFLLLGAGLAGVASAVVGIGFTDWHPGSPTPPAGSVGAPVSARAAILSIPGGAALATALVF